MFVCSVVVSGWFSAQRWLSACFLDTVSDIFYCRALGWGFWIWATLPMEVVTMSPYVTPVASSFMIWLMLMVEIPGVTTIPMGRELWGASEAISNGSSVCRQAVTPVKLHGGVIGQMTANSHTGKEGLDGVGVSSRGLEALMVCLGEPNWSSS